MIFIKHKNTGMVLLQIEEESLEEADLRKAKLDGADLSGMKLDAAILTRSDLRGADLTGAELNGIDFTFADLRDADLTGATLEGAMFYNTLLENANFTNATLIHAQFTLATLSGVDFSYAILGLTKFSDCEKLFEARGLDTANYVETSSVDDNTVKEHIELIPNEFLIGCGYTSEHIQEARTRYGPYHSCFISYARLDGDFVDRLYADLKTNHVSCWCDEEDLRAGRAWENAIEKALHSRDRVLFVCSEQSLNSENVRKEITATVEFERLNGVKKLIPLNLDNYIMSYELEETRKQKASSGEWPIDWVTIVKTHQMLNFQNWNEGNRYAIVLKTLLRDLKQVD